MKDIEIEIQEEQQESGTGVQLPLNFLSFGEMESDDVKVYIKQSTYKALEKLASSDTTKELGSILIGDYSEEMGKTHVVISDYVEAKYTDASASTLTFTHETWDYVHKQHESHFQDKRIVGWQHTHPNYGIFLSNYDMFIQENFFNLPFQIAYVIDPIQNLRGFFQWKNGKIEKLKGYYIYDDVGKPIKIEQTKRKDADKQPAKRSPFMTVLVAVLCLITLVLGISVLSMSRQYRQQQAMIAQQTALITQLQQEVADGEVSAQELMQLLQDNQVTIENQQTVINELEKSLEENAQQVRFKVYTVEAGDNLISICEKNGVDFYADRNMILGVNGLTELDMIYVGQKLLIPVVD